MSNGALVLLGIGGMIAYALIADMKIDISRLERALDREQDARQAWVNHLSDRISNHIDSSLP